MRDQGGKTVYRFRPEELPQPVLIDLFRAYCELYYAMDGFWYVSVMNNFGNDKAEELNLWVWRKMAKREMDRIAKLLDLRGSDVAKLAKALSANPWFVNAEHTVELEGQDRALFTVTRCSTLEALEKEGAGRESRHCREVDGAIMRYYAEYFNPAIKVKGLVLPPRRDKSGLCCQWEFSLEDDQNPVASQRASSSG